MDVLHSERFADTAPAEVWATLLDEGAYLGSVSTFYRVLRERGEVGERRRQATRPATVKPELMAAAPNQVWSWDITGAEDVPAFVELEVVVPRPEPARWYGGIFAVPETMAGVKNTASQPHRAYTRSPRCSIFSRRAWCLPGWSSSCWPQRRPIAYPPSPPASPATTATTITAARSSRSWLAATAAAPRQAVPMTGTPAHAPWHARRHLSVAGGLGGAGKSGCWLVLAR